MLTTRTFATLQYDCFSHVTFTVAVSVFETQNPCCLLGWTVPFSSSHRSEIGWSRRTKNSPSICLVSVKKGVYATSAISSRTVILKANSLAHPHAYTNHAHLFSFMPSPQQV